jgi:hypothetical protein
VGLVVEDPRELAKLLCEQVIESWVHDSIWDFLVETLEGAEPSRELHDKVYDLALTAIITIPEEG